MNKTTTALLALTCAIIGLASSYVTGQFFILGLEKLEADVLARQALITSGILMIVVELAAFGLAALLPRATLRGLMSAERMGTRVAGEYLERLGLDGVVSRAQVGWVLV